MKTDVTRNTVHPLHPLSLAFVVLEGFDLAVLSAALEAVSAARRRLGHDVISCTTLGMSALPRSHLGIPVTPNNRLGEIPLSDYDVVVLIGGSGAMLKTHFSLTQQLKLAAKADRLLGGIWNGAYHLAAAGLIEGYECLITGDGRFTLEPPIMNRRRSADWQFDEHRMTCRDAYNTGPMMEAMFEHFFGAAPMTGSLQKRIHP